ncbi:MAG: TlpA family protein disulfide reductase [Terriglobales bacterium]
MRPVAWLAPVLAASLLLASAAALAAQSSSSPYDVVLAAARAAMAQHHYAKARQDYQRAARLPGANAATCDLGMADADGMRASFGAAEKECRRAAQAASTPVSRAAALQLAGALELKRAVYAQAVAIGRSEAQYRMVLPSAKDQRRWLAQGEADLRAALQQAPQAAALHFDLAACLLREGRIKAADPQLQTYLRLDASGPLAPLARSFLANPDLALAYHAPPFTVLTSSGDRLTPQSLEGKVVLLDFWGSWCPPCRESVPFLQQLWKRYGRRGDFVLLSIDSHEPDAEGAKFIAAHHMIWPQYWDFHSTVEKAFAVHSYPTFILLNRQGVMRARWSGEDGWRTGATFERMVRTALRANLEKP